MSRIKFGIGSVKEKKKIIFTAITMLVVTVSLVGIIPTRGSPGSPPLHIYGRVVYQDGTPVVGALVNLTDMNNGNYSTDITNDTGEYSIVFGGAGGPGWEIGDKLVGFVNDTAGNQGTNDTIMEDVGSIRMDFVIDTPITEKHLVGPTYGNNNYYITLDTIFNFTATDPDGIKATYIRIWHNGAWHPTPGAGAGKNNNFWRYGIDIPINFTLGDFDWAGEGIYYIEFYSEDNNPNIPGIEYTHNQTHDVDETAPIYNIDFGCPTVNTTYAGLNYTMIRGCAPIWIYAHDTGICQSGVKWLNITGSYIGEWPGQTVEPRFEYHILDNGLYDEDDTPGVILANVSFCEDSFHEIDIVITDYVGNEAVYDIDLAVDYEVPTITKTIVGPTYLGPYGNDTWLSCKTTIWLNATDSGCNGGAGVEKLGFTIWWKENESSPVWNTTKYPPVVVPDNGAYNATIYDLDPTEGSISVKIHLKEDCYHLLKGWVIDRVGNNNTLAVKNKHYVDCTPPGIMKTLEKVVAINQSKMNTSTILTNEEYQSFIANWSYIDAVSVYLSGYFDPAYENWIEIYDENYNASPLAESEHIIINGSYEGWIQFHLPTRLYVKEGETYWLRVRTQQGGVYWHAHNENPYPHGHAIIGGDVNKSWDFAFKIEYYPAHPYPVGYTLYNEAISYDGLNNTWLTTKATLVLKSWDEGCMNGVGLKRLLYRIWFDGNWHPVDETDTYCGNNNITYVDGKWWYIAINKTDPDTEVINFTKIRFHEECEHVLQIRAEDFLGNVRIINQTHKVDDSWPTDEVGIPENVHGYYKVGVKQFVRACKGIWINITDEPECAVGLREATIYWRYEYTNFTTPYMEPHPVENEYHPDYGYPVYKYGKWWWKVESSSAYIHFDEECMHKIYYFYEASDWLDNSIVSEEKNVTIHVDAYAPEVYKEHPWHGYYNETYEVEEWVLHTIWKDSFEDGDASDWTIGGTGYVWAVNDTVPDWGTFIYKDGTYFLLTDDDAVDENTTTYAVTPSIDCTNYSGVYLSFAVDFEDMAGSGEFWVNVSNDGGATWTNVWYETEDNDTFVTIDISAIADGNVILINFTYDDDDDWAWGAMIDNITVYGYKLENVTHIKEYMRCGARINLSPKDMPDKLVKVDPYQTEGNLGDTIQVYIETTTPWPWDAQSFIPVGYYINATKLYLNWTGNATVTVYIHDAFHMTPEEALGNSSVELVGEGEGWVEFDFEPGIPVNPGETYYIEVHRSEDSASVHWFYTDEDKYLNGTATISGEENGDWKFQILYYEDNPCASGVEGIYYGYLYNGTWHPTSFDDTPFGEKVVDISTYYDDTTIDTVFYGHYLWYEYDESIGVRFKEECNHVLFYWAKDNVCHYSSVHIQEYFVDNTPPQIFTEYPEHGYMKRNETIFFEDFEDGYDGWTIINASGNAVWEWTNTTPYGGGYGYFMYINDTSWWDNNATAKLDNNTDSLISPQIDCRNYTEVWLSFFLRNYEEDPVYVSVSNNAGESWNLVDIINISILPEGPPYEFVYDITDIAAGNIILVNFTYKEQNRTGFAIVDNVTVNGTRYEYMRCFTPIHLSAVDLPLLDYKYVDQFQVDYTSYVTLTDQLFYNYQSFVPTVERLDAVELLLSSDFNSSVYVYIYDEQFNLLGSSKETVDYPSPTWVQFHFSPPIWLIPGDTYYIVVTTEGGWSGYVYWWFYDGNKYPEGDAWIYGSKTDNDFAFKTEYYGSICASGVEGIYWRYVYNNISHPTDMNDTTYGEVINLSKYYPNEPEIANYLWYVYNDSIGIYFTEECMHELYYFAKDNVCNHTEIFYKRFYVDNSEPIINKTYPKHGYEVYGGKEYLRKGANITLYADDMPNNECSAGTWLYWRYETADEKFPWYGVESFEYGIEGDVAWEMSNESYEGNYSAMANGSYSGTYRLWLNVSIPSTIERVFLSFWHKADNLGNYTLPNMLQIVDWDSGYIKLLAVFNDTNIPTTWKQVTFDLSEYIGHYISILWLYRNSGGEGEYWYIDYVELVGWEGVFGWENVSINISFDEECWHKLYYFAKDTVCHTTDIHEQEYYVDGTPPETSYEIIAGGFRPDNIICIQDKIKLIVNNSGQEPCIYPFTETYYRWVWIDENGTKHYYPDASTPGAVSGADINVSQYKEEIEGYYWLPYTEPFNFTEGCTHWLYFFSKDGLCNTEKPWNVTFGVDDEPPETEMEFQGVHYEVDLGIYKVIYIRNDTIIWLNATDMPNPYNCTTGVNYTMLAIWKYNYSKPGWDEPLLPWTSTAELIAHPIPGIEVYHYDALSQYSKISIRISIKDLVYPYISEGIYDTDCGKYEIHWYSVDYNPFEEQEKYVDVIIDCTPPESEKEYGKPVVEAVWYGEVLHWITSSTPIWINASDDEVWDSGVWQIYYRVVNLSTGWDSGPILLWQYSEENPIPSAYYTINGSDGMYEIYHWAVDKVGHVEDYTPSKQHVILDDTPPTSRVADIIPWEQEDIPFNITVINITDHGPFGGVGVCKVEVYYKHSHDNVTWTNWTLYAVNESLIINPDGTIRNWTLPFTAPNGSGYYRFISIAYDCLGNKEQPPFVNGMGWDGYDAWCKVPIDRHPPIVTKEYSGPNIEWDFGGGELGHAITSYTKIWLNATDMPEEGWVGIDKIYWSFDNTTWYEESFNGSHTASVMRMPYEYGLLEGEVHTIFFKASDIEGHISNLSKQKFIIDDTPPTTEIIISGNETMPFNVTVIADDAIVGTKLIILYYRYSADGTTWGNWMEYGRAENVSSYTWQFIYNPSPTYYKPGYYEFYAYAEDKLGNGKGAPTAEASCYVPPIPEDLNGDGRVNVMDLYQILMHWGESDSPGWIPEDLNKDGAIDVEDIYQLLVKWTG